MSIDTLEDSAEPRFGRLEPSVGSLIGERTLQAKGLLDEVVGAVGQVCERASDTARGALGQVADGAHGARAELKALFDGRPGLATGAALGVGIALGARLIGRGGASHHCGGSTATRRS